MIATAAANSAALAPAAADGPRLVIGGPHTDERQELDSGIRLRRLRNDG